MENLSVYFIISVFSFIAGFLCRVYFDRRSDAGINPEFEKLEERNKQLKVQLEELQRDLSKHESKLRAAADRAAEIEELERRVEYAAERVSDGVSVLTKSSDSSEKSVRRAEELVAECEDILDKVKKKS